ncbi:TetR/AcrR family transcriptional regulator [Solihabitans fulvus]|uniref:TetR/AcrR family transcriptional regulator n=1 Tax=Solihabitans fulvus TaxID=1892852 RepID=A0A5B2XFL4_9PSEU|nr:TetR/AcrR family transcriptional regulator [Solihabitans fulvus]KAA2262567.1 TetR/AcrR family transcriptional regulator [Solihabitans fulvus]
MTTSREDVLRAAAAVLLHRPRTPMEDIARAAGISRATLHRMVPSRAALVRELAAFAVTQTRAALASARLEEGEPVEAVRRVVDALMPIADLYALLSGENQLVESTEPDGPWSELDGLLIALYRRGQEAGAFRLDLPAEWFVDALSSMLVGASWAVHDGRLARRDAPRALVELLLGGIRRGQS